MPARWTVEVNFLQPAPAFQDLARRLGGWSQRWNVAVDYVRFGLEQP